MGLHLQIQHTRSHTHTHTPLVYANNWTNSTLAAFHTPLPQSPRVSHDISPRVEAGSRTSKIDFAWETDDSVSSHFICFGHRIWPYFHLNRFLFGMKSARPITIFYLMGGRGLNLMTLQGRTVEVFSLTTNKTFRCSDWLVQHLSNCAQRSFSGYRKVLQTNTH